MYEPNTRRGSQRVKRWFLSGFSACVLNGCTGLVHESLEDELARNAAAADDGDRSGRSAEGSDDAAPGNETGEGNGANGSNDPTGPSAPGDNGVPTDGSAPKACATPGPRLIRRLTATQYRNTLVDLFADPAVPEQEVLADPAHLGFHIDADEAVIRDLGAEQLLNYTEKVAAWAVSNKLAAITTCTTNDVTCRKRFITEFGQKALRQPLTPEMVATYETLMAKEPTFEDAARTMLSAMLMSPYLLFRRELGESPTNGTYALTAYERASLLSYLITDSLPDAELWAAASSGALNTEAELDKQADRLLATARGQKTLEHFLEGWLEIDRLRSLVKDETQTKLSAGLREKMLAEAAQLFHEVFNSGADVKTLLSANYTFVDKELSDFYGIGASASAQLEKVTLSPQMTRLPGIMGAGAFLASHALADATSPVKRGYSVRTRLLCQALPDPPQGVDTNLKPPPPGTTNRERYRVHSENASCNGCHRLMDPVGFTFEHFDTFGRYQAEDKGLPIDDSGMLAAMPEGDVPLDGAADLISYLADNQAVQTCLVRFWSYYAFGRDEWKDKSCTSGSILEEAVAQGGSLESVFKALLHAPHFNQRVKDL